MKAQLHRVGLDGTDDQRLTDPAFHHTVTIAPNHRYFVDVAETHDTPPASSVLNRDGDTIKLVVESDDTTFQTLGLKPVELFTFTAADNATKLHGLIHYPSTFDPAKKYPVLINVYGGPGNSGAQESFTFPNQLAEFGFIILELDARTAAGRGRAFIDPIYKELGIIEIDDFAAAIRSLHARPWFDADRVGVYGTSYGGTAAALLVMRYPDLIQAAVSNSPVSDWQLYDSVYSERYLGLPDSSPEAYEQAAVLTYVQRLVGDLMIYYGTSDDNVHPKNALQLIAALQRAGKSFDVQIGPDKGHTSVDQIRMMEFFIERLVMNNSNG